MGSGQILNIAEGSQQGFIMVGIQGGKESEDSRMTPRFGLSICKQQVKVFLTPQRLMSELSVSVKICLFFLTKTFVNDILPNIYHTSPSKPEFISI